MNTKKRVKIPANAAELVALARRVKDKHTAEGDASALRILNWQEVGPVIDESVLLQEKASRLKRELLETYQKRDFRLEDVVKIMRASRDILTGKYGDEIKALGQWGYDVLDTRTTKPETEPIVLKQSA